jgi:hypothetical protein
MLTLISKRKQLTNDTLLNYASCCLLFVCAYNNNSNTINQKILIRKIELKSKWRLGFEMEMEKREKEKGDKI